MALKSKMKLRESILDAGYCEGIDYHINFEAYGRKVEGYAYPIKGRMSLEQLHEAAKSDESFKARKQESCGRVIVQVSYFKAYGWNH